MIQIVSKNPWCIRPMRDNPVYGVVKWIGDELTIKCPMTSVSG